MANYHKNFQIDFVLCNPYSFGMFDEELPKKQTGEFPRNLESMSLSELGEYVGELKSEILRVQEDMAGKKASQDAAASVFK